MVERLAGGVDRRRLGHGRFRRAHVRRSLYDRGGLRHHRDVILGLHHVALRVADPERSLAFYSGVLGLSEARRLIDDDGRVAPSGCAWAAR